MITELVIIGKNFNERSGVLYPKIKGYKPSLEEQKAIMYLCEEWDFCYDPDMKASEK